MMAKPFVPHDQLTAGLWYLRTFVEPFYTVVSVFPMYDFQKMAPGELAVWLIDEEGNHDLAAFDHDQFIGPVPPPSILESIT